MTQIHFAMCLSPVCPSNSEGVTAVVPFVIRLRALVLFVPFSLWRGFNGEDDRRPAIAAHLCRKRLRRSLCRNREASSRSGLFSRSPPGARCTIGAGGNAGRLRNTCAQGRFTAPWHGPGRLALSDHALRRRPGG